MKRSFLKMHGLGNDFVILDHRAKAEPLSHTEICLICDRRRGIGCDQLIVLEPPQAAHQSSFMRIYNPDGSQSEACGNATRCVGKLLLAGDHNTQMNRSVIGSLGGDLAIEILGENQIQVEMPIPRLAWHEIPLRGDPPPNLADPTLYIDRAWGVLAQPTATNMGNPHVTFFVENIAQIPLSQLGPLIENDALFPARVNVGIAQILNRNTIRLLVWERGAGLTQACGSGACAALVAAVRRGVCDTTATLTLDGGDLTIAWPHRNAPVLMTGAATLSFQGIWENCEAVNG